MGTLRLENFKMHMNEVAHQAGAYPSFCSMKQLGIFLLPPGWDANPLQRYPGIKFATHLYTGAERGTVRVKCLAQEHHNVPDQGLNPDCLIRR